MERNLGHPGSLRYSQFMSYDGSRILNAPRTPVIVFGNPLQFPLEPPSVLRNGIQVQYDYPLQILWVQPQFGHSGVQRQYERPQFGRGGTQRPYGGIGINNVGQPRARFDPGFLNAPRTSNRVFGSPLQTHMHFGPCGVQRQYVRPGLNNVGQSRARFYDDHVQIVLEHPQFGRSGTQRQYVRRGFTNARQPRVTFRAGPSQLHVGQAGSHHSSGGSPQMSGGQAEAHRNNGGSSEINKEQAEACHNNDGPLEIALDPPECVTDESPEPQGCSLEKEEQHEA